MSWPHFTLRGVLPLGRVLIYKSEDKHSRKAIVARLSNLSALIARHVENPQKPNRTIVKINLPSEQTQFQFKNQYNLQELQSVTSPWQIATSEFFDVLTRDIFFRQNFVNFSRRIRLSFPKNGRNFQKWAFEVKRLFSLLNYSKDEFKTVTFEKFATNLAKRFQRAAPSIFWLKTFISHKNSIIKAYIFGAKMIEIGIFGAFWLSRKLISLF